MTRPPPRSTLFPYPTLFRSLQQTNENSDDRRRCCAATEEADRVDAIPFRELPGRSGKQFPLRPGSSRNGIASTRSASSVAARSEEHTSELQSPCNIVCRLLL